MKITADQIRKLRDETGAPVIRAKKVLEECAGDEKKAFQILEKEGFEKAAKREGRETKQGIVDTYIHHSGKVASVVEIFCETDFVAKNELFKNLAHEIALQVASMGAGTTEEILNQDYIKDPSKKISDLVKAVVAKTGENVQLGRTIKIELGKE